MRILLLSRYGRLGASSRVRSLQYLPFFNQNGINVDVEPLFSDEYLKALYGGKSYWKEALAGYWNRLKLFVNIRKYDFIWLEKEIFPFLPAGLERLLNMVGVPYVVDFDDALFHRYDKHRSRFIRLILGRKIDAVMKHAALVIAGNEYLAERARSAGARRVEIVPTAVDVERYSIKHECSDQTPVVGWIGSPSTSAYLLSLKPVFELLKEQYDVRFVAVGARQEDLVGVPIEARPWSEETEVQSIQAFDVGIMPLPNTPWEQGKCGYKLIQYMACGLPVVASPVGINEKIIKHGDSGFLADGIDEWREAIGQLLGDHNKRKQMGKKGRLHIESLYSMQMQAPRLLSLFKSVTE